jgi:hypothetical protein
LTSKRKISVRWGIIVEIADPSISVTVQGEDIQITKSDSGEAYQIKPGEHTLHVKHGDLEFDTDEIKRNLKIVYDALLPKWNYRATPQIRQ